MISRNQVADATMPRVRPKRRRAEFEPKTLTKMPSVAVVGAGPAGLMAADVLAHAGLEVTVFDRMGSVGRKFLLAGRGGLNITHSEELPRFLARYADGNP